MKRLLVMAVTCVAVLGCAASQYKFTCAKRVCEVETSGPAELDFRQEFGATLRVVETGDGRVTMQSGDARRTFATGDSGPVEALIVEVKNVKGENAIFTVRQ